MNRYTIDISPTIWLPVLILLLTLAVFAGVKCGDSPHPSICSPKDPACTSTCDANGCRYWTYSPDDPVCQTEVIQKCIPTPTRGTP